MNEQNTHKKPNKNIPSNFYDYHVSQWYVLKKL